MGNDLPGMPVKYVANPTACQKLCQSNSNCNFWTYRHGYYSYDRKCWLKSSDTGRVSALYEGLTSGPKKCGKLSR